jgi:hypothetical protein
MQFIGHRMIRHEIKADQLMHPSIHLYHAVEV